MEGDWIVNRLLQKCNEHGMDLATYFHTDLYNKEITEICDEYKAMKARIQIKHERFKVILGGKAEDRRAEG